MSHIGNFKETEKPNSEKHKNREHTDGNRDKSKLSSPVKNLSDDLKIDYYKKHGMDNMADIRKGIRANNENNGLSYRPSKLNSDNFDKLSKSRKYTPEDAKNIKESFAKWSPEARDNKKLRNSPVVGRHAKEGEQLMTTHSEGRDPSGKFVTKKSLGKTDEKRQEKGALSDKNTAKEETPVKLARDQNLVSGKIGPQKKFENSNGVKRPGGGYQIITDGGYANKAIKKI